VGEASVGVEGNARDGDGEGEFGKARSSPSQATRKTARDATIMRFLM
jgi:hypothetical protein